MVSTTPNRIVGVCVCVTPACLTPLRNSPELSSALGNTPGHARHRFRPSHRIEATVAPASLHCVRRPCDP
eukprot:15470545-Alexandrium_andersonii.AAC.1